MRAFVVEFAGADDSAVRDVLEGRVDGLVNLGQPVARAIGELAPTRSQTRHDPEAGEPA